MPEVARVTFKIMFDPQTSPKKNIWVTSGHLNLYPINLLWMRIWEFNVSKETYFISYKRKILMFYLFPIIEMNVIQNLLLLTCALYRKVSQGPGGRECKYLSERYTGSQYPARQLAGSPGEPEPASDSWDVPVTNLDKPLIAWSSHNTGAGAGVIIPRSVCLSPPPRLEIWCPEHPMAAHLSAVGAGCRVWHEAPGLMSVAFVRV